MIQYWGADIAGSTKAQQRLLRGAVEAARRELRYGAGNGNGATNRRKVRKMQPAAMIGCHKAATAA